MQNMLIVTSQETFKYDLSVKTCLLPLHTRHKQASCIGFIVLQLSPFRRSKVLEKHAIHAGFVETLKVLKLTSPSNWP